MIATTRCTAARADDREFVDRLRECLGLDPLYETPQIGDEDASFRRAVSPVADAELRRFYHCYPESFS